MRISVSFYGSAVSAAAAAHALNHPLFALAECLHLEDRGCGDPIPMRCCATLPVDAAPSAVTAVVQVGAEGCVRYYYCSGGDHCGVDGCVDCGCGSDAGACLCFLALLASSV